MMTMRRPQRKADVLVRRDPDGSLLVDTETGSTHLLNHTALAVWELCDGQTSPAEMIDAVCELCNVPPDVAREDITRTLDDLQRADLLVREEEEQE